MSLIDLILNLAGLLLWFNWRSANYDPLTSRRPATLIGTLRPASPSVARRWMILASIPVLLFFRGVLYWQIGVPADWVPKLNFGFVVLPFRVDRFPYALLFSVVSFLRISAIAYVWLAALCLINRRVTDPEPLLKLARLQLGRLARAPLVVQILAPLIAIMLCWVALHPLLVRADIMASASSIGRVFLQGLLVACGVLITLKLLLPLVLLLHMLLTYVYLGSNPLWDFIAVTSKNFLAIMPFSKLRSSKLDFAPLAGILAILLLLHTLPEQALRFASSLGLTVWPQ